MAGLDPTLQECASVSAEVVIIGGGLSGTLAATVLARSGHQVCLIDRHDVYPPDFRAEHLDGQMVSLLRRLGLLDDLTPGVWRGETVTVAGHGRIIRSAWSENYGLRYETMVNRARALLPTNVCRLVGRVVGIEASDTMQQVHLASGQTVSARVAVIATGQGYALCKQLGISRHIIRNSHSLTFGFDMEPAGPAPFEHSFLVYQGERIPDRIDYLAAFTLARTTRINLFTYRDYREPWTRAFMDNPGSGLAGVLPGLARVMGPYRAVGPVVVRPIDLYVSQGHRRAGVVLIGDAFQASCPATGIGVVRLLTDIEQLCRVHVPAWLASPGMGTDKIAAFYDDPVKRACDAKALHDAEYRRAVSTETSMPWRLHRARVRAMTRISGWRNGVNAPSNPRIDESGRKASLAAG